MTYRIAAGARVTVRRPGSKPTDWFSHVLRRELEFKTPTMVDRVHYVFNHEGWTIRVARALVHRVIRKVAV